VKITLVGRATRRVHDKIPISDNSARFCASGSCSFWDASVFARSFSSV